jgi:hypothetical protein
MIGRAWAYIISTPGFSIAAFIIIWLTAWASNGLWKTTFDLTQLRDLGIFVLGRYAVDSGLNSPIGKKIEEAPK